jgi:hypothetical protein
MTRAKKSDPYQYPTLNLIAMERLTIALQANTEAREAEVKGVAGGGSCAFCADRQAREAEWVRVNDKLVQEREHSDRLLVQMGQKFQKKFIELNDKRIAAEARAKKREEDK